MARIVNVVVIDLTRPVEQKGFKTVGLFDLTQNLETSIIYDTKNVDELSSSFGKSASAFFANGGKSLLIGGKNITNKTEIAPYLTSIMDTNPFYGVNVIMDKANQKEYIQELKTWVSGVKGLALVELNGEPSEILDSVKDLNSDRIVVYANKIAEQTGLASAVSGACFPQEEGSINWGNQTMVDIPVSKYSLAEEQQLLEKNVNYITEVMGLILTQYGKTTSGSNADITRSKDFLSDRIEGALTFALANNKKIPFTTDGLMMISSALDGVGMQAVNQGMLDSFRVDLPKIDEVPVNDKANRVLRGVKFNAILAGAIDSIELELVVKLG